MVKSKFARDVLRADIGDPEDGLLVPVAVDYFMKTGRNAQYTDNEGIKIIVNLFKEQNDRVKGRRARVNFSGGNSANCMRQQVIDINMGNKNVQEPDYRLINIFEDGVWRNLRWIIVFHRMGILVEYEKSKLSKKYNFRYTPDCWVDLSKYYGEEYKLVPVEIKGMNTNEFGNFRGKSGRSKWAGSRTMQVHSYMLASGAKNWLIWAEDKNTQDFEEFWMPRDPDIIKYLKKRYIYMQKAMNTNKLPAIECEMDDSDLKYTRCPRKEDCKAMLNKDHPTLPSMKNRKLMESKASEAFV